MSGLDKQVSRGKIERLCYRKGYQFCYSIDRFVNKGLSDRLQKRELIYVLSRLNIFYTITKNVPSSRTECNLCNGWDKLSGITTDVMIPLRIVFVIFIILYNIFLCSSNEKSYTYSLLLLNLLLTFN